MAVASGGFIVLTEGLGIDIPKETYGAVTVIVVAYILGESFIDAKK